MADKHDVRTFCQLSRFDLVFILLDKPDEARDRMISSHIMRIHNASAAQDAASGGGERPAGAVPVDREEMTLTQRLRRASDSIVNHVPYDVLRKCVLLRWPPSPFALTWVHSLVSLACFGARPRRYISYARQYCHPKITAPAAKVLVRVFRDRPHTRC